jgi:hypothetical protein
LLSDAKALLWLAPRCGSDPKRAKRPTSNLHSERADWTLTDAICFLELWKTLPGPGKLVAVKDAQMDLLLLELLGQGKRILRY